MPNMSRSLKHIILEISLLLSQYYYLKRLIILFRGESVDISKQFLTELKKNIN